MNPDQLQQLREKLTAGRQPVDKGWSANAHPRGWNDALDFVERAIREVLGEKKS